MPTLFGWLLDFLGIRGGQKTAMQLLLRWTLAVGVVGGGAVLIDKVVVPEFFHKPVGGNSSTIVGSIHYPLTKDDIRFAEAGVRTTCKIDPDPYPVVLADGNGNVLVPATMKPVTHNEVHQTISGVRVDIGDDCYEDFSISNFPNEDVYQLEAFGIPFLTFTRAQLEARHYNLGNVNPG